MKEKVIVTIYDVISEEQSGISDSILADYMLFDVTIPSGKPVIAFKYCPWCGKEIDIRDFKIMDVIDEENDDLESWQKDSREIEEDKEEETEDGTDISEY